MKRNGFTLIEALLSLLITSILSLCLLVLFQTCLKICQMDTLHQEQMAVLQLRQMLAISQDIEIFNHSVTMIYQHQKIWIGQDRDRLVRKEGYEILMEGVQNVLFTQKENEIYLSWTKEEKHFTVQLC